MRSRQYRPNYKQGPSGSMVADYRQDAIDMWGDQPPPQITSHVEDIRDNRDPQKVGEELLTERAAARASMNGQ